MVGGGNICGAEEGAGGGEGFRREDLQEGEFEQNLEPGPESYAAEAGRFGDLGGTAYLVASQIHTEQMINDAGIFSRSDCGSLPRLN